MKRTIVVFLRNITSFTTSTSEHHKAPICSASGSFICLAWKLRLIEDYGGHWKKNTSTCKSGSWLVVLTYLKNISQIGNLLQIGVKIKNNWNHHLWFNVTFQQSPGLERNFNGSMVWSYVSECILFLRFRHPATSEEKRVLSSREQKFNIVGSGLPVWRICFVSFEFVALWSVLIL